MTKSTIIDIHMHMYRSKEQGIVEQHDSLPDKHDYVIWEYGEKPDVIYSSYDGYIEDVLEAVKEAGAKIGVVLNYFNSAPLRSSAIGELSQDLGDVQRQSAIEEIDLRIREQYLESNKWICDLLREHDQLVPFISADPIMQTIDVPQDYIYDMVEHHGVKGIKIHPALQLFYMDDPKMLPIWRACVELDIPILTHSGPSQWGNQYSEPKVFAEVLKVVPDLRLMVAHLGGAAWKQTSEFAKEYRDVYFDCSEIIHWTGAPSAPSDRDLAQLILDVGPKRVMMGSDFPWYDVDWTVDRVRELPLLANEQKESIIGTNAETLLKL